MTSSRCFTARSSRTIVDFQDFRPFERNALVVDWKLLVSRELRRRGTSLSRSCRNFDARGCRSFVTEITYRMKFLRAIRVLDNAKNKPKRRRYCAFEGRNRDPTAIAGPSKLTTWREREREYVIEMITYTVVKLRGLKFAVHSILSYL